MQNFIKLHSRTHCALILFSLLVIACGGDNTSQDDATLSEAPAIVSDMSNSDDNTDESNNESDDTNDDNQSLQRHNVLLIIADDLGVDSLSLYPYSTDVAATPTLETLAQTGITFDYVWATPVCTTSRATILTGAHGIHSGVNQNAAVLSPNTDNLPNLITSLNTENTVKSAAFGKWHLAGNNGSVNHPNDVGFDFFSGNMRGSVGDYFNWSQVINGQQQSQTEYHTTVVTDAAINWISQQSEQWFAYVAYASPHTPLHLPPLPLHSYTDLDGTESDIAARPRDYFNAMIESLDTEVGRLLNGLSSTQRANTTIIFMGDNGTGNQVADKNVFPSRHVKGSLYEGGIRVPMVIHGAGVERGIERTAAAVNTTDLYSTIAELMGLSLSSYKNSYSIASWLRGSADIVRKYNYTELNSDRFSGYAVSDGQYKLIVNTDGDRQLYDISTNFIETDNLSNTPQLHDVEQALMDYATSVREASD